MCLPSIVSSPFTHDSIIWKITYLKVKVCFFVCGISKTSGQLFNELFPDCTRSCFSQEGCYFTLVLLSIAFYDKYLMQHNCHALNYSESFGNEQLIQRENQVTGFHLTLVPVSPYFSTSLFVGLL